MAVPVSQLDEATIEYLRNASNEANSTQPGVVVPQSGSYFVGPRSGWFLLTLIGIGLLSVAVNSLIAGLELPRDQLRSRAGFLAFVMSAGFLLLLTGFVRWRRKDDGDKLGNFLYADSAQLWIVQDREVTALEYSESIDVDGTHYYENGVYQRTQLTVKGLGEYRYWTIPNRSLAERFAAFLRIMGHMRQSSDPTNQMLVALRSPHIGRFALLVLDKDERAGYSSTGALVDPPRLAAVREAAPALGWGGAVRRCLALTLVWIGLGFALPALAVELRERRLFERVEQAQPYSVVSESDAYLKEFRDSHRSEQVRELRDERLFAGITTPITGHSTELEQIDRYLADSPNGRHTAEARAYREDHFAVIARQPGTHKETVRAIDKYLDLYPTGRYVAELKELREERFYALAKHHLTYTDEYPHGTDSYLAAYPTGKYAAEVRATRDDHLFARAQSASRKNNSPSELRKYLADKANVRNRTEANQLIAGYYDRTIADLKARTAVPQKVLDTTGATVTLLKGLNRSFVGRSFLPLAEKAQLAALRDRLKVDDKLVETMIGLVQSLKTADDPVLTVAFIPEIEPDPTTEDAKEGEAKTYALHMAGRYGSELRNIEKRSLRNTALIAHASTFDSYYVRQREDMIFTRLDEAIRKGIKADILTLRKAKPGEKANIEVRYRIFPAGFVVPFCEVDDDGNTKGTIGLVREYYIDWTISFRAPGSEKATEYRAETRPGPNLLYYRQPGDPDWAIYAVSLYSAFYDLSEKMMWGFGQDPGKAPSAFTFAGIGSQREDRKSRPGDANPFNGYLPPKTPSRPTFR